MTRTLTVSFRNEDEPLWEYIEEVQGKPVTGTKIRDLLYAYKSERDASKEA